MSVNPLVYLVQSPSNNEVRPWLHFAVDGVMVSAYEFMVSDRKRERLIAKGWADTLEFEGPIMLDSGGFQHLKGKQLDYSPEELARFAKESRADYAFSFDHPPRPSDRDFDSLSKRNFRSFVRMSEHIDAIPIIHAPPQLASREIRLLRRYRPLYVGVGGLVPSLRGAIKKTFQTIDLVQRELPDSKMHLLGFAAPKVGATYLRKAHSVDYAGWRTAAATSYLLTPNGYRKITFRNKSGHAARPNRAEQHVIRSICQHLGIPRRSLPRDFEARAIFNAYVALRIMKAKPFL